MKIFEDSAYYSNYSPAPLGTSTCLCWIVLWPFGHLEVFQVLICHQEPFGIESPTHPFSWNWKLKPLEEDTFWKWSWKPCWTFPGIPAYRMHDLFFFFVGNCQQRSHHILHLGIFWKTWCPCPPDLSTGCRSECQQRSTAKVKVDEGNGRKKVAKTGATMDDHFASMVNSEHPNPSLVQWFLYYLTYFSETDGNWWILRIELRHSS